MTIYTHTVYWIHLEEHTDPETQGYVGVTGNPEKRYREHLKESKKDSPKNIHLARAMNKHQVKTTLLFHGTKVACYELEFDLRPARNIGWNIQKGGKIHTDENIRKRSNSLSGRNFSPLHKERLTESKMGNKNPMYGVKYEMPQTRIDSIKNTKNKNKFDIVKKAIQLISDGKSVPEIVRDLGLSRSVVYSIKNGNHGAFGVFPELKEFHRRQILGL
jgi:hypothetical protein